MPEVSSPCARLVRAHGGETLERPLTSSRALSKSMTVYRMLTGLIHMTAFDYLFIESNAHMKTAATTRSMGTREGDAVGTSTLP